MQLPPPIVQELRSLGNKVRYAGPNGEVDIWRDDQVASLEFDFVNDLAPFEELADETLQLKTMSLRKIGSVDLSPLTKVTTLRDLDLTADPDCNLAPLKQMSFLDSLGLYGVSQEQDRELQLALPNCSFIQHGYDNTNSGGYTPGSATYSAAR